MNVYDAAENAENRVENAVERTDRLGHGQREKVACTVARTYLEGVFNDEDKIEEALGMTFRRLERGPDAKLK